MFSLLPCNYISVLCLLNVDKVMSLLSTWAVGLVIGMLLRWVSNPSWLEDSLLPHVMEGTMSLVREAYVNNVCRFSCAFVNGSWHHLMSSSLP